MANRKEYEMAFLLNAALNGNFKGTFSKAQQEFAKLGREIQDLQKLQANVSSYQKQEQAIASTTTKLSNLQQQSALLEQQIKATRDAENQDAAAVAALEREKLKLEQRIKDTETALERQKQKLEATGQKLQDAGIDTKNLTDADARLTEQLKELHAQQDKAAESAQNFGAKTEQAFEAVSGAIAAAGITSALKEVGAAYIECVTIAGDFQAEMSNVEALSGATAEDMANLTAQAKGIGAATKYTATEAAQSMGYMAMAGWDAQQMLSGMSGVINLARASGEELALVSDIVTDNLTAFGLTAADTAHFADVLAAAATNSNTSVSVMGETFKQSAAIAGALGYSIEDVAVGVGLMANAGVKGSIAGTALKNTFNGLLEGATLTAAAFGEYEFSTIKADGTMKDFSSSIDELRGYFDQMTEAERVNNAMVIAGQRGYNGLLAILNSTDEDYAALTESINECSGAAEQMAEIKMDNLNGQLALMNSAWDALKTTIGEQFNPELRELAELGTDIFTAMDSFVQENPAVVKGGMVLVGTLGALTTGVVGLSAATKVFKALDLATLLTGPAGVVVGVVAGIAALTAAVVALNEAAKDSLDESWELTAASREQYEQLQELNSEYDHAVELYGENSYEAQRLRWQIEELNAAYENGKQTFEEYKAAHEAVIDGYTAVAEARKEASTSVTNEAESIGALIDQLAKWSSSSAEAAAHQGEIQAIVDHLNESLPGLNLSYSDVAAGSDKFITSLQNTAQAEADARRMAQEYENYVNSLSQRGILESEKNDAAEQVRLATEDYQKALAVYNEAASMYQYDTTGFGLYFGTRDEAAALDAAQEQLNAYQEILDETTVAYEENEAAIRASEDAIQDYTHAQEDAADGTAELGAAIDNTMTSVHGLVEAYNEAYEAALESVQGQYAIWDEAEKVVATSASSINSALESQVSYWTNYNANLESLRERTADIEGLGDVIASFADGSADSVNAIAGMANASDEDLSKMVANYQELQQAQSETSQSLADMKTAFSEQMDILQQDLAADIEAMDLSADAAESGRATIQGYIDAANDMLPQVESAYQALARAASDALGAPAYSNSSYAANGNNRGYATGTDNAAPGFALVGENGPELVLFHGGETVLNAAETAETLRHVTDSYHQFFSAYATGTDSAAPGPALVGENGPELVWMQDANQSFWRGSAQEMAAAYHDFNLYGGNNTMTAPLWDQPVSASIGGEKVEVHIHLEAGAARETVEALEDYVQRGELAKAIRDVWDEIQADTRRLSTV